MKPPTHTIRSILAAATFFSLSITPSLEAQEKEVLISNLSLFGQNHGLPHGLWTNGTFGNYLQTLGDFDQNGVTDLVIDAFGYTIVLLKSDGTVLRMLPGHTEMEHVIGPGDLNKDGIPDLAYMRDGNVYLGMLNSDGWITEERTLGLSGIGDGFTPDGLERVGDINGNGVSDIGIHLQSSISSNERDRRFGVVFVNLSLSGNREGEQFVAWDKGEWRLGNPDDGSKIDLAASPTDLQQPADGRQDFILVSMDQNDEVRFNYIDFNADGSAAHYLSSTSASILGCSSQDSHVRVFDEANPANGNFRFRMICNGGNYVVVLDETTKEIVSVELLDPMIDRFTGNVQATTQIDDISGDDLRDYIVGDSYTFYNDDASAFIQSWSENNGRGLIVNSNQNGGWKIFRPGDQYGAAISVEPASLISNSFNVYQMIGVRARDGGRGGYLWQHLWDDSGVQGSNGAHLVTETEALKLEERDLFGTAVDVAKGYIGASGRNDDRGALFRIANYDVGGPFHIARYAEHTNPIEINLGSALLAELTTGDEFGASVEGYGGDDHPYDVIVGAYEKNKSGGKNTGAVYLLDIEANTVTGFKEIGRNTPLLGPLLDDLDHFGSAVALIGDLDGNGYSELAVGARVDDDGGKDRGAVYILFMNEGATITSVQKISSTQGGFQGNLPNSSFFGEALARLGDINNDGIPDLAVGSPRKGNGVLWILTLNNDGTVKTTSFVDESFNGISLDNGALFGGAIDANYCGDFVPGPDFDCRPSPKLWVSARGNDQHRGTIWAFDFELGIDDVIPVDLTRFDAVVNGTSVALSWHVASELNNAGFSVERRTASANTYRNIGFVEGQGTGNAAQYGFVDEAPPMGQQLFYRLKQIDFDGTIAFSPIVEVDALMPASVSLHPNYPNPFNPSTTLSFDLPTEEKVSLAVYDMMGREIYKIVDEVLPAGQYRYELVADGLASGTYIYRLVTSGGMITRNMILLK